MDASLLLGAEICSGVGGGLILIALILFGLRLPYFMERFKIRFPRLHAFLENKAVATTNIVLFTSGMMLVVIAVSLFMQLSRWAFFGYGFLLLGCIILYLVSLVWAVRQVAVPVWIKQHWNMQKIFGGGVFADFANAIGLLGGVGAYKLSSADEGWFWLGLFGAILAILVGMSLALRSTLTRYEAPTHTNPTPITKSGWFSWNALGNLVIGVLTLASITSPIVIHELTPPNNFDLVRALYLKIPLYIAAVLVLMNIVFYLNDFGQGRKVADPDKKPRYSIAARIPGYLMLFVILGLGAALIVSEFYTYPDVVPAVFGAGAFLTWIIVEFGGLVENFRDYLKVIRGLVIILGCIFMVFLILWIPFSAQNGFSETHWFIFSEAFVLIGLGVCLGIVINAYALVMKPEEAAARALAAQAAPAAPVLAAPALSPVAEAKKYADMAQKEAELAQTYANLAQFYADMAEIETLTADIPGLAELDEPQPPVGSASRPRSSSVRSHPPANLSGSAEPSLVIDSDDEEIMDQVPPRKKSLSGSEEEGLLLPRRKSGSILSQTDGTASLLISKKPNSKGKEDL